MVVHTLNKMIGDKEKMKFSKGETSGIQFAIVKTKYPADSSLQKNAGDLGPDPEHESDGISQNTRLLPKKPLDSSKQNIKSNISKMQGSMKETHGIGSKVTHRFEMRS
jgi:hypothetical protein